MSRSAQALIHGIVQNASPTANSDNLNTDVAVRMDSYGGIFTQPRVRKQHVLVEEGNYFVTNNSTTGVTITTTAAFDATKGFISIYNASSTKKMYMDYITLVCTTAGSAASTLTSIQAVWGVGPGNGYSSAGSSLTSNIKSPNMNNDTTYTSSAIITAGQLVTTATSQRVLAFRSMRPCVSGTVADVVGGMTTFNFGGVEGSVAGNITVANANIVGLNMPATVIGPNCTAILYVFYAASNTPVAAAYAPEVGWWEK